MSCHRKLENSETLLAESMNSEKLRFSRVYKNRYSLYIKAFEANCMISL